MAQKIRGVDGWYGLWGTAAPMMDLSGGATQYVTPIGGDLLKEINVLKE